MIPVPYGDGVADRIREAAPKVDAFIDTYGGDYVELALNELGVEPSRVDTIVRFDAVEKYGIKAEGNAVGASASTLAELAELIANGELEVPIAATYPLDQVRDAYRRLEGGHIRGKIVLQSPNAELATAEHAGWYGDKRLHPVLAAAGKARRPTRRDLR